jgi:hypothetical protein
MHRKLKRRTSSGILDLDSLMDILSCLVGVMLFLVIYTVLELGSVAYEAEVPAGRLRPIGAEQVVVLAHEGTVRMLDVHTPLRELLSGFEIVRQLDEVAVFVDGIGRTPADANFAYSLVHHDRLATTLLGTLDLVVEERQIAVGDSLHQLGPGSAYARALERLDPGLVWISFAVDSLSVDAFRRARELAVDRGFATGWDQLRLDFPLTLPLAQERRSEWFNPRADEQKPER